MRNYQAELVAGDIKCRVHREVIHKPHPELVEEWGAPIELEVSSRAMSISITSSRNFATYGPMPVMSSFASAWNSIGSLRSLRGTLARPAASTNRVPG